jgi:hypothetical protein
MWDLFFCWVLSSHHYSSSLSFFLSFFLSSSPYEFVRSKSQRSDVILWFLTFMAWLTMPLSIGISKIDTVAIITNQILEKQSQNSYCWTKYIIYAFLILIPKLYDLQELLPFKVDNNVLFHANFNENKTKSIIYSK